MGRRIKQSSAAIEEEAPTANGLHCATCGEMQFEKQVASNARCTTCKNGHDGAASLGPQEVEPRSGGGWQIKKPPRGETGHHHDQETEAIGEALATEVNKAEGEDRIKRARIRFASANAAVKTDMQPQIARMIETVFIKEQEGEFERLNRELRLGENRTDHGSVIKALDDAQTNVRRSFDLWITVKNGREQWEKSNEVLFAGQKSEAYRELQAEKNAKQRNKQITDADVTTMCALLFGDEWVAQEVERERYKDLEAACKNLSESWVNRSKDLQAMSARLR